jgi:hypothetical protein
VAQGVGPEFKPQHHKNKKTNKKRKKRKEKEKEFVKSFIFCTLQWLDIKPRTLHMLGRYSTTKLHSQPIS